MCGLDVEGGGGSEPVKTGISVSSIGELSWWIITFSNGDVPYRPSAFFSKRVVELQ